MFDNFHYYEQRYSQIILDTWSFYRGTYLQNI